MLKDAARVDRLLGELTQSEVPLLYNSQNKFNFKIYLLVSFLFLTSVPSSLDYSSQKLRLFYSLTVCHLFKTLDLQLLIICIFELLTRCT